MRPRAAPPAEQQRAHELDTAVATASATIISQIEAKRTLETTARPPRPRGSGGPPARTASARARSPRRRRPPSLPSPARLLEQQGHEEGRKQRVQPQRAWIAQGPTDQHADHRPQYPADVLRDADADHVPGVESPVADACCGPRRVHGVIANPARDSARPPSDGASASPIARYRALSSTPAAIAAPTPPCAARTASDPNCAAPQNTMIDITIGATVPISGRARTPNEIAITNTASPKGSPRRMPA